MIASAHEAAERLHVLYAQSPTVLASNAIGQLLLSLIFWPLAPAHQVLAWLGSGFALWLLGLSYGKRTKRIESLGANPDVAAVGKADSTAPQPQWRNSWFWLVLAQGSVWPIGVWLFWGLGEAYHQLALILVVYTYCLIAVQLLATQRAVLFAFLIVVLCPTLLRIGSDQQQPWHLQLAGVLLLPALTAWWVARGRAQANQRALSQALQLNLRSEEVAQQLRVAAAASEQARRAAEAATLAKTQFFAAASHDLKQPLHAMGMFAEALRQRCGEQPEVARLATHIHESVDMLEGMFGEVMDLTRIDAGATSCQLVAVSLRPIFSRLKLQFEPLAFDKGLMFSMRGERHLVQADPVLLERILSNLVGNAVRYTEDGGVLVSCRPRAGKLLVQVWDSGIGIPQASLPNIFDEFFQVRLPAVDPTLSTQQRKGFGLGLAIVKRMATLMGAPLSVQSVLGRGTVFSLELRPANKAARETRSI